jgi:hypothetical protein
MKIGEVYFDGYYHVMIVGKDEDTPIWFIAISYVSNKLKAQCPFIPVHEDVLISFTETLLPEYSVQPSDISGSIEFWLSSNKGSKNAFSSPVREIWEVLVDTLQSSGKKPSDFFNGEWYNLPIFFPIDHPSDIFPESGG